MRTLRESLGIDATAELPAFAWPGGYQIGYVTDDGGVLCAKCANSHGSEKDEDRRSGWFLEAAFCSADSDSCSFCDHCNAHISNYCDSPTEHSEHCDNA